MSKQEQAQATAHSPASQQLREMIRGFQASRLIRVAAKLGLADVLTDGPKSCNDLAQAVQTYPRARSRMLRMLASADIFTEHMVTRGVTGRVVRQGGRLQAGLRVGAFVATVAFLCVFAGGCVTPAAVKDASTQHTSNLEGVEQAVGEYRRQLDAYYNRLIRQQREAHIARHVDARVAKTAEEQSASIAQEIRSKPDSQKAATDFIQAGAELADAFEFWGNNFDRWVEHTKGETLAARRQSLQKLADELEEGLAAKNKLDDVARKHIKQMRDGAKQSDDELTYVDVAIKLKKERAELDAQLDLLAAQITTMQAFHAKIDEFLSIDATIDAGKIAAAAAAGSKGDTTGILGQK